jgi:tetratricopeptide (TPR) repeat protein
MMVFTKHSPRWTAWVTVLLGVWAALQAGCSFLPSGLKAQDKETPSTQSSRGPSITDVKVESDYLALEETESPAISPQQLVDTVSELLADDKPATAQHLVHLYPDVAWDLLRNATADEARNKALQAVALAHDRQCTEGDAESGWQALLIDRARDPDKYRDHDRRRAEFLVAVRNGRPSGALALGLTRPPEDAPGVLLSVDAWHLTGVALLLDERPDEATDAFGTAIDMADRAHPYQAAHLKLLLSDAQRRVGNTKAADATWDEAVQFAGNFLTGKIPIADPIFWERAAYLRPVDENWPTALTERLARVCHEEGVAVDSSSQVIPASASGGPRTLSDEQPLWACIGCWRLDRGAPQAALIALKRAEAMTSSESGKQQLQLLQAKALLALDQPTAATGMLVRLASSPDPQLSRAAMATLGTAKLQAGSTKQGFNLLRRAVEEDESIDWPARAEAEGDLGLAYLLVGNEQDGLKWLHRAQARFESAVAHEHLVQSLENELAYLQQADKKHEAKSVNRRLAQLQAI